MTDKRYVSSKEAAEILNLSVRRVVGLCNAGRLEGAFQKDRGWRIPEESVEMYKKAKQPDKVKEEILSCAVGNTSYMLKNDSHYSAMEKMKTRIGNNYCGYQIAKYISGIFQVIKEDAFIKKYKESGR